MNPNLLFTRLLVLLERYEGFKPPYSSYNMMRKPKKGTLIKSLLGNKSKKNEDEPTDSLNCTFNVIDGGPNHIKLFGQ